MNPIDSLRKATEEDEQERTRKTKEWCSEAPSECVEGREMQVKCGNERIKILGKEARALRVERRPKVKK